jgi:hypothetical protein
VLSRTRPIPEPVDDPDLLDWTNPGTRIRLINALMADPGPLSFLARRAAAVLEVLINRRNPHTGQLDPSWLNLGAGARYKDRSVAYAVSELRRTGLIASVRRCYGLRPTSCAYVLTCKLLVLAGLVREHAPDSCAKCRSAAAMNAARRPHNLQTNRDLLLPSGISTSADRSRSKKGGEPRRVRADHRPLFSKGSGAEESTDPNLTAFVAVFQRERHAMYGDNEHGSVGAENRSKLSAFLADFVGGAWAWSEQQGLERARGDVANELFEEVVRSWLAMPGTNGFVRERRHPIGLLVGDLDAYGALAREAWERKQVRPKPLAASAVLPGDVTAAEYAAQLQAQAEAAEAALPEFDAAELVALAEREPQAPERGPAAEIALEDDATDPIALAHVERELAVREQRAAYIAQARAARASLLPTAKIAQCAPVVVLFPAPACGFGFSEDEGEALYEFADNDTGDDKDFFAHELERARQEQDRARQELAFLADFEAEKRVATAVTVAEPAPIPTENRPRTDREGSEAEADLAPASVGPRPPRFRRPGSRPFTGTTGAPGRRPDAWRAIARPETPVDGDDPPDE